MKMNLLTKLANILANAAEAEKVALEQATLPDGTVIEADTFEAGVSVFIPSEDGELIPLPQGMYDLDNGNTITVDDMGVIVEVVPTAAEEEAPAAPAAPEAEMAGDKPAGTPAAAAKKVIESNTTTKETQFSKEEVETKLAAVEAKHTETIDTLRNEIDSLKMELTSLQDRLNNEPATGKLNRSPEAKGSTKLNQAKKPLDSKHRLLNKFQTF